MPPSGETDMNVFMKCKDGTNPIYHLPRLVGSDLARCQGMKKFDVFSFFLSLSVTLLNDKSVNATLPSTHWNMKTILVSLERQSS